MCIDIRCFKATKIRCILMDDGLGSPLNMEGYQWHDQFTTSKTKRIVRIEVVAETILAEAFAKVGSPDVRQLLDHFDRHFRTKLKESGADSEVVGFKSVVCYRTGLGISSSTGMEEKRVALKPEVAAGGIVVA